MNRPNSPKGEMQQEWKPKQHWTKGHFPDFNISLLDMLETLNIKPDIFVPKKCDNDLCRKCGKEPRHKTATRTVTYCKKCYSEHNKIKHGLRKR